jgi:hypothetical protein
MHSNLAHLKKEVMKRNYFLFFCIITLCITNISNIHAQDDDSLKVIVNADICSRYVWRGLDYGSSPSIQPTLSLTKKNFEIGYWGAISTLGTYNETDLYLKYTLKNFNITVTDYFFPVNSIPSTKTERYFNYEDKTTGHVFEGLIGWKGSEKFPLYIFAGVSFYGADKDTSGNNRYSTYAEAGYSFKIKNNGLDAFIGFTPYEGLYGNGIGIVNIGLAGSKKIKITENFELPAKVTLVVNPQTENIHLVFGITL